MSSIVKNTRVYILGVLTLVAALATIALTMRVAVNVNQGHNTTLPVYGRVESLELIDQEGQVVTANDLKGTVHIVNFIFTSCQSICPKITAQMKDLQKRTSSMKPPIKLISISVDPENDSPSVLKEYGKNHGADFSRWMFLTGPLERVQKTVTKEFMTGMEKITGETSKDILDISHGAHFAILDTQSKMRAFKHADSEAEIKEILDLISRLNQQDRSG